jgi:CBS domain-containing protein
MHVSDVMTAEVATTTTDTPLREAASTLAERRISGMPVLADDGSVLGVVSEADVLAKEQRAPENGGGGLARLLHHGPADGERKHRAEFVGEAMTTPAITTVPYASIASAASQMLEHGINRLPVLNGQGRIVGIVSRADLVRAFVRTDDEIVTDVREQVALQQALTADASVVDVVVTQGDVALTGAVRRRSDAEVLPRIVRMIPGVIDVRTELSWSEDE